jgi:DNA-binding transcriptional LysR family regulator
MLDVRRLRVLREVARQGSLSAAAVAMGYTQPAVSRQIATLESEVGVQLVLRVPKGVELTDAGRMLVERTEDVLVHLEDVEEELHAYTRLAGGRLRMSVFASSAASVVPLALTRFRDRHPAVELRVSIADPPDVLPQVRAGALDIALCNEAADVGAQASSSHREPATPGLPLDFVYLFDDPMYVALPPDHPLATASQLDLVDLANEPWMVAASATSPDMELFYDACRAVAIEPRIAFEYDDYAALLGFVAAGVGASLIPDMVARNVREDVVIRDLRPPLPARPVTAAVRAGYRSPAVTAMLEILQELAPEWVAGRFREPSKSLA